MAAALAQGRRHLIVSHACRRSIPRLHGAFHRRSGDQRLDRLPSPLGARNPVQRIGRWLGREPAGIHGTGILDTHRETRLGENLCGVSLGRLWDRLAGFWPSRYCRLLCWSTDQSAGQPLNSLHGHLRLPRGHSACTDLRPYPWHSALLAADRLLLWHLWSDTASLL